MMDKLLYIGTGKCFKMENEFYNHKMDRGNPLKSCNQDAKLKLLSQIGHPQN